MAGADPRPTVAVSGIKGQGTDLESADLDAALEALLLQRESRWLLFEVFDTGNWDCSWS